MELLRVSVTSGNSKNFRMFEESHGISKTYSMCVTNSDSSPEFKEPHEDIKNGMIVPKS